MTITEQVIYNLKILDFLKLANENGIQYPRFRLHDPQSPEKQLVFQLAGSQSRYKGAANITDGRPYGQNIWFGRINKNGSITYAKSILAKEKIAIEDEIAKFAKNPTKYAKLYGKITSNCMFCGKTLTDPQSIAVGYGPICAEHYGLPHGEVEQEIAEDMAQIEFELPNELPKSVARQEHTMTLGFTTTIIEGNPFGQHIKYSVWHICDKQTGKVLGFITDKELAEQIVNEIK